MMVQQAEKFLNTGKLIVFEGIDGTGKSTQLKLLSEYLKDKGYQVETTREPSDGKYGRQIRELFHCRKTLSKEEELQLFLLDRRDHVKRVIMPHLTDRKIILCDRYYLSTIAYQGAAGFDLKELTRRNSFAPRPDIALLFEQSAKSSIQRITAQRGDTLNDFEKEEELNIVGKIFASMKCPYIRRINAEQSVEAVHQKVVATIAEHLEIDE